MHIEMMDGIGTPTWILLFTTVGFFWVLRSTFFFVTAIYRHFLRRPKDLVRSYGKWALVTGSTNGIGKALAFHLASRGLNVLLVARCPSKLEATSVEIRSRYDVDVRALVVDLATEEFSRGVRRIAEVTEDLDVGVVVNNAGTTYPTAMYLDEVGESLWNEILRVNLMGVMMVTKAVVPAMLRRGRGAVVCIGSGSAFAVPSFPLFTVYAATKSYVDQLCRNLHVEYKDFGIDVQCQIPMYVATKMVGYSAATTMSTFFTPLPDNFAGSAVRWIGYEKQCLPHWTHALQCWLISFVPDSILNMARLNHGINRRNESLSLQSKCREGIKFN